jgi:hypothetical protein
MRRHDYDLFAGDPKSLVFSQIFTDLSATVIINSDGRERRKASRIDSSSAARHSYQTGSRECTYS